jgi:hypothetical protein
MRAARPARGWRIRAPAAGARSSNRPVVGVHDDETSRRPPFALIALYGSVSTDWPVRILVAGAHGHDGENTKALTEGVS